MGIDPGDRLRARRLPSADARRSAGILRVSLRQAVICCRFATIGQRSLSAADARYLPQFAARRHLLQSR